jgi:hypothetical protein
MSSWKIVVVAAALGGCAGLQRAPEADLASGHWEGEIDNNGWRRPVSFDLERTGGSWRGQWQLVSEVPGQSLQNVEVSGRDVRFEAGTLRVAGHVDRGTLRGTVTDKAADEPVGQLSVTNQADATSYNPGSEWLAPSFEP